MTMENDSRPKTVDDLMKLALLALAAAHDVAEKQVSPAQLQEIRQGLAGGTRRIALFISRDNVTAHLELALIDARAPAPFSVAIVLADTAIETLLVDRRAMN